VSARATTMSSSSMHRSWLASTQKINGDEFWRGSRYRHAPRRTVSAWSVRTGLVP
jgi:hypothetical protein